MMQNVNMNIGMDQMNLGNNLNQLNHLQNNGVNSQMYLLQNPNIMNAAAYISNNNNFHNNMDQNDLMNQHNRMMAMNNNSGH